MASVNRSILIGNVGKKPELRQTHGGKPVCSFGIAINEKKGEPPMWVQIVTFDKTAEACAQYLDKGSSVFVDGRLSIRSYEKDGQKKQATEVIAHQVLFLDKASKQTAPQTTDDEDWA